jgi:hypothetical protein
MRGAIVKMLHMPNITFADFRVGMVVLELTAGHSKFADNVARAELARRAGVSERTVTRSLQKFAAVPMLEWRPARAKGQLGTLILSRVDAVDIPELPGLTRDIWLSRVQPNPRQDDDERETNERSTRDTGDVPVPPSNPHSPPREESPTIERVLQHLNRSSFPSVRERAKNLDFDRLQRIIDLHPDAPIDILAGAAIGEQTNIAFYGRKDTA